MSDKILFQISITEDGELKVHREATSVEMYGMLHLELLMQEKFLLHALTSQRVPVQNDPVDEIIIPLGDDGKLAH